MTDAAARLDAIEWRRADAHKTANVTPAVFGLIATVVGALEEASRRRDELGRLALVQAQTPPLRRATLARLGQVGGP